MSRPDNYDCPCGKCPPYTIESHIEEDRHGEASNDHWGEAHSDMLQVADAIGRAFDMRDFHQVYDGVRKVGDKEFPKYKPSPQADELANAMTPHYLMMQRMTEAMEDIADALHGRASRHDASFAKSVASLTESDLEDAESGYAHG